jgi:hypothetical protein
MIKIYPKLNKIFERDADKLIIKQVGNLKTPADDAKLGSINVSEIWTREG